MIDIQAYNNYDVKYIDQENLFAVNATLSGFDGFYVAAAITGYDGDPNPIEDPTIGTLKMYLKTWNVYDEENGGLAFHEIPLRPC